MIDWFVLLTPLALLPVFLLFVFIGCVLDPSGTKDPNAPLYIDSPIYFKYGPEVVAQGVVSLDISVQLVGFEPGVENPPPVYLDSFESEETILIIGMIPLSSEGSVTCLCDVSMGFVPNTCSKVHEKIEDEPLQTFELVWDSGTGWTLS